MVVPCWTQTDGAVSSLRRGHAELLAHHEALAVIIVDGRRSSGRAACRATASRSCCGQHVDLARLQRGEAVLGRERHELDLVRVVEDRGRDGAAKSTSKPVQLPLSSGTPKPARPGLEPQISWPRCLMVSSVAASRRSSRRARGCAESRCKRLCVFMIRTSLSWPGGIIRRRRLVAGIPAGCISRGLRRAHRQAVRRPAAVASRSSRMPAIAASADPSGLTWTGADRKVRPTFAKAVTMKKITKSRARRVRRGHPPRPRRARPRELITASSTRRSIAARRCSTPTVERPASARRATPTDAAARRPPRRWRRLDGDRGAPATVLVPVRPVGRHAPRCSPALRPATIS